MLRDVISIFNLADKHQDDGCPAPWQTIIDDQQTSDLTIIDLTIIDLTIIDYC